MRTNYIAIFAFSATKSASRQEVFVFCPACPIGARQIACDIRQIVQSLCAIARKSIFISSHEKSIKFQKRFHKLIAQRAMLSAIWKDAMVPMFIVWMLALNTIPIAQPTGVDVTKKMRIMRKLKNMTNL